MKIKSGLLVALLAGLSMVVPARSTAKTFAPDALVRDLYAARKAGRGPFLQTKSEGGAAPASKQPSAIRSIDFLNHSYQTSVCSEDVGLPKTVKVSDGKFSDRDSNFFEVVGNETAYGDVNGDGSEDAVVLIRCGSAAGTLRAFEVHAYTLQNGQMKLLARLDSTAVERDYRKSYPRGVVFYAGETAPKVVNRHVVIEALTDGSFAGPENTTTFDYQLRGGRFVLSRKPTRKKRAY